MVSHGLPRPADAPSDLHDKERIPMAELTFRAASPLRVDVRHSSRFPGLICPGLIEANSPASTSTRALMPPVSDSRCLMPFSRYFGTVESDMV